MLRKLWCSLLHNCQDNRFAEENFADLWAIYQISFLISRAFLPVIFSCNT
jgi:hypothetical protein